MKIIERTFNAQTGETVDIERDETAVEKKYREAKAQEVAAELAEAETKKAQRQVILDRLGITSEEAKILLGA